MGGDVGKEGTMSTSFPEIQRDPDTSTGPLCVKAGLGPGPSWGRGLQLLLFHVLQMLFMNVI